LVQGFLYEALFLFSSVLDDRGYYMACYSPLQGYRSAELTKLGKRKIVFSSSLAIDTSKLFQITVSCGQCIGCRLERSRQWAIRCMHEAKLHDDNCFITLTYRDDCLPKGNTLVMRDFQLFMKRLRKRFGNSIRFFHCGEYGEKFGRPHYHACLFNFDFPDKVLWKKSNGMSLFTSAILDELWPYGFSTIGSVTFESAAYVARYIMKKKFGDNARLHYADIDFSTGELLFERKPEYVTMSRRPGIGKKWIDSYMDDTYKDDFIVLDGGKKVRPPRYYDSQYELFSPSDYQRIKNLRKRNSVKFADNNTPDRLHVREIVLRSKLKSLPRNLDDNS
jgi:hypothetical protein